MALDIVVAIHSTPVGGMLRAFASALSASVAPTAWVYNKGSNLSMDARAEMAAAMAEAGGEAIIIEGLPNVGRCDHSYMHHILSRWARLAPLTLFVKDTTMAHVHLGVASRLLTFLRRLPRPADEPPLHFWCARPIQNAACWFEMPKYASEQCRSRAEAVLRGQLGDEARRCYEGEAAYIRSEVRPLGPWLVSHSIASGAPTAICVW